MLNVKTGSVLPGQDVREYIRIKGKIATFKFVIARGKEGNYFVVVAPSVLVSGYAITEEEARQAFDENIETFFSDLMQLNSEQRKFELKKLGFQQEKFHTKNFSKVYVDKNGVLQGIEPDTLEISTLEMVA
jgi:predicted RNase H-like HicB family nuclease